MLESSTKLNVGFEIQDFAQSVRVLIYIVAQKVPKEVLGLF